MPGSAQDIASAVWSLMPASVRIAGTPVTPKRYDPRTGTTSKPPEVYYVVNVRIPRAAERAEEPRLMAALDKWLGGL